jgi:hypothetical protein
MNEVLQEGDLDGPSLPVSCFPALCSAFVGSGNGANSSVMVNTSPSVNHYHTCRTQPIFIFFGCL